MRNYEILPLRWISGWPILIGKLNRNEMNYFICHYFRLNDHRKSENRKFYSTVKWFKFTFSLLLNAQKKIKNFIVHRMMISRCWIDFNWFLNRIFLYFFFSFRRKSIAYYFVSRSHNAHLRETTSISYSYIKSWLLREAAQWETFVHDRRCQFSISDSIILWIVFKKI